MKTLDMEIILMGYFSPRVNLIVLNVSWGMNLHECDVLVLSGSDYATEVEIKRSKADILADKKKAHGHRSNRIARLFFAVPCELTDYALIHIPERAGLISIDEHGRVKVVRQCQRNKLARKWTKDERLKLAHLGNLRILPLMRNKQRMLEWNTRNETRNATQEMS
jgi:hypothetical protein